jgi:phosphoadenosine phosphosulfate reductase
MSERPSFILDPSSAPAEPAGLLAGEDLAERSRALEAASAEERIAWAFGQFGESGIPVILVDTGYLFPETYRFIDDLTSRLRLNLKVYRHEFSPAWQEARWGKLWEQGLEGIERYNDMNKVQPMDRALAELDLRAVMAGVRRQQSRTREQFSVLGFQKGRVRLHPIVDWTDMDIGLYLTEHGLPYHPLWDEGYVSIGDWHTSRKLTDGMTAEETRFFGLKRECGLNENLDFVI